MTSLGTEILIMNHFNHEDPLKVPAAPCCHGASSLLMENLAVGCSTPRPQKRNRAPTRHNCAAGETRVENNSNHLKTGNWIFVDSIHRMSKNMWGACSMGRNMLKATECSASKYDVLMANLRFPPSFCCQAGER